MSDEQALVLSGKAFLDVIERAAKDPAVDVVKMQALFQLAKEVNAERARAQFNGALAALQAELPEVDEDAVADFGGTDKRPYASFENIVATTRPLLSKHAFSITFSTSNDKPSEVTVVGRLLHADGYSVESQLTLPSDASGKKNPVQALASAISYAERHIWKALLGIATRKADDDGEAAGSREPVTPEQAAEIDDLILRSGVDRDKFLEWTQARSVTTIPGRMYAEAVRLLRARVGGRIPSTDDLKAAVAAEPSAEGGPTCLHAGIAKLVRDGKIRTDEPPPPCRTCGATPTEGELRAMGGKGVSS